MSSVTAKRITGDHLDKPFGVAFYPPGPHPQYLYVPTPVTSSAFLIATAI
jgi:hypothetical protein